MLIVLFSLLHMKVVTGNYYRNADGFIFVYDATSRTSFEYAFSLP